MSVEIFVPIHLRDAEIVHRISEILPPGDTLNVFFDIITGKVRGSQNSLGVILWT